MTAQESHGIGSGTDLSDFMVVVVGAHLRAEVADRPLAYGLCERINQWFKRHGRDADLALQPVVCSDVWYVNQPPLQQRPTISLGGPGVNALSAYYANKLPSALVHDDHMVIQLDPEYVDLRVSIWGVNHELTVAALALFTDRYFDDYLQAVATQVEPHEG